MTTFYHKKGRKYIPVSEYDSEYRDSWPIGAHAVICSPGSVRMKYNIDPLTLPMLVAGMIAEEKICKVINDAMSYQIEPTPLTPEQMEAWKHLQNTFEDGFVRISAKSIADAVQAGINELINETSKLLTNPVMQSSYDNFIALSNLTKDH